MTIIKLTKSAKPITDPSVLNILKSLDFNKLLFSGTPQVGGTYTKQYIEAFGHWIKESRYFQFTGLENYTPAITDGVTGAFPNFLYYKKDHIPVVLKGEYPIHRLSDIKVLGSIDELKSGQKLYLSHPFSANGDLHPHFMEILEVTKKLNIPIFLDCAYIATAKLDTIDLNYYSQIEFVAFSLSKVFSTGRIRSGVCYSKFQELPMHINTQWDYLNQLSLAVHIELMKSFDAHYFYDKYKPVQEKLCQRLQLSPSSSYLFGLSNETKYDFFSREKVVNRICLTDAMSNYSENDIKFEFAQR